MGRANPPERIGGGNGGIRSAGRRGRAGAIARRFRHTPGPNSHGQQRIHAQGSANRSRVQRSGRQKPRHLDTPPQSAAQTQRATPRGGSACSGQREHPRRNAPPSHRPCGAPGRTRRAGCTCFGRPYSGCPCSSSQSHARSGYSRVARPAARRRRPASGGSGFDGLAMARQALSDRHRGWAGPGTGRVVADPALASAAEKAGAGRCHARTQPRQTPRPAPRRAV